MRWFEVLASSLLVMSWQKGWLNRYPEIEELLKLRQNALATYGTPEASRTSRGLLSADEGSDFDVGNKKN